jgi:hypothetical protein
VANSTYRIILRRDAPNAFHNIPITSLDRRKNSLTIVSNTTPRSVFLLSQSASKASSRASGHRLWYRVDEEMRLGGGYWSPTSPVSRPITVAFCAPRRAPRRRFGRWT